MIAQTVKNHESDQDNECLLIRTAQDPTHQDVPNVLIGSFEAAEADADPQEALAPPHVAGRHRDLPHVQRLAAVHLHLDGPLHVQLQQLFEVVVVFVLSEINTLKPSSILLCADFYY